MHMDHDTAQGRPGINILLAHGRGDPTPTREKWPRVSVCLVSRDIGRRSTSLQATETEQDKTGNIRQPAREHQLTLRVRPLGCDDDTPEYSAHPHIWHHSVFCSQACDTGR